MCRYGYGYQISTLNSKTEKARVSKLIKMGENMELLEAQAHVWNHTFKYFNSMSLKCALELGIPDIIHEHGEPMRLSSLASTLHIIQPTKVECLGRLMRLLVHCGFFAQTSSSDGDQDDVKYSLMPPSRLLLRHNNKLQVAPILFINLDKASIASWESLGSWFSCNDSSRGNYNNAFEMANGKSVWDYVAQEASIRNLFHQSMVCDPKLIGRVLTSEYRKVLEGLESLVDVGGGAGILANTIVDAIPNISYIVFDLPQIVSNLQPTSQNLTFVGGDMFQPNTIPPANAVLLKSVLHNWSDEECIKILKNCRNAIPKRGDGGKVIIIDIVIESQLEDNKATETQLYFDVLMMVHHTGKQRNEAQWKNLFLASGFTHYDIITNQLGLRSLIEVYP